MTWKQKHTQNSKYISLYMASLEYEILTYEQRLKLITEIGRLNLQNQFIDQMLVEDYHKDCMVHKVPQSSKISYNANSTKTNHRSH